MKVFLSWSGEPSRYIAETLREWLVQVIQALDPWISTGIDKGTRWSADIAAKLEESKVGIFCLTRDNLESPWLHFEAGAISKTPDAYVCTFLYNLKPADVKKPLGDFQATVFEKQDIFKLLQTINGKLSDFGARPLSNETLTAIFGTLYPQLEAKLKATPEVKEKKEVRSDRELLEEILENTRNSRFGRSARSGNFERAREAERKSELKYRVAEQIRLNQFENSALFEQKDLRQLVVMLTNRMRENLGRHGFLTEEIYQEVSNQIVPFVKTPKDAIVEFEDELEQMLKHRQEES